MRTALRVPWDVPVRLVPVASGSPDADRTVHTVAVGRALPGVRAVRVTTVRAEGAALLERVDPITRTGPAAGETDGGLADGELAVLLATLAAEDGVVPVLVDGTPFTHAVLDALVRVPCGRRITYAELAAAAGRPRAVRAVASVMARNRVPLVLPCHRIVPSAGGTGRYGWGDAVKVALLDAEADAEAGR